MKIATFNVNSLRSRLSIVCDWLRANAPDALCLQETRVQDCEFPAEAFRELGYRATFRGEKSYNGVAVLSMQAPDEARFGLNDEPRDETRLAHVVFGRLHIVNTYVPQGRDIEHPMFRYKLEWFSRLRAYFAARFSPDDYVLWTGDLNIAPTDADVHMPERKRNHVCFHSSCREAFLEVCGWGFEDVFRKHRPDPGEYSFFDYRVPSAIDKGMGWRIDHILATRPLTAISTAAYIDLAPRRAEQPSDHTPVVAEFAL